MIHGITVTLYERAQNGTDSLGNPTYTETPVQVENVLVGQPSAQEVQETTNLTGRLAVYTLGIPKGDTHTWEDCRVDFWGKSFRVFGPVLYGIPDMIPGPWNGKATVERYES